MTQFISPSPEHAAPRAVNLIARKRDGDTLTEAEWEWLVRGFMSGEVADYQMAAMLMAIQLRGMTRAETFAFTNVLMSSGETIDLRHLNAADKHSTGGVGDKVTLIVAPIVAACGVPMAKMTGRGLAHTGGTVDKLESISGFRAALSPAEFKETLERHGLVLAGQSEGLAPADGAIYALRDVTATAASIPLIASSIMSKKLAIGAATILLDVKVGSGALIKRREDARRLARLMVAIGRNAGRRTVAMITEMSEPLGRAVGNALEVRESIEVLRGGGPPELRELCLDEAAHLLSYAGRHRGPTHAREAAERALDSGEALTVLQRTIAAQDGDHSVIERPDRLPVAPVIELVRAPRAGYILKIEALAVGHTAVALGAGRATKRDRIRHDTGVLLLRIHGDEVTAGEPIAEIHAGDRAAAQRAADSVLAAVEFGDTPPPPRELVLEHIG